MSQRTLDFFAKKPATAAKPAANPAPQAPSAAIGPLPKRRKVCHAPLQAFTRGNQVDPDYLKNPQNKARHECAMLAFGPKPKVAAPKREYKPMELQFVELKRQYPDTILLVEVGYRYRLWGQDAVTVARHFGFKESNGWLGIDEERESDKLYDKFATWSFPTVSIANYVQKLVDGGFKVGLVNQSETSAIKKSGTNKSGPFKRQVSAIYTRGTFINDFDVRKSSAEPTSGGVVMGIYELQPLKYAICSVSASTGEIVYDVFNDSAMTTELETRMLHLEPCEIIQIGQLGSPCLRIIDMLKVRNNARIEEVELDSEIVDGVPTDLDEGVQIAASHVYRYLQGFNLEAVFKCASFSAFNISSSMVLNGNTLASLEIFQNSTDFKTNGSLFWVMDKTRTKFGRRMLRKWVSQPLLDREKLEIRVDAVHELLKGFCNLTSTLNDRLKTLPDLELFLLQIHYGRITRKQLYEAVFQFHRISTSYTMAQIKAKKITSPLLRELFDAVPVNTDFMESCLKRINPANARDGKVIGYFYDNESADINTYTSEIQSIKKEFEEYIKTLPLKGTYGDDYMIEVKPAEARKVPESWQKMSATKTVQRFRTPETFEMIKRLELATERLEAASDEAFTAFIEHIKTNFTGLQELIKALAHIDCLMSLSGISSKPGYTKPDFVDEPCIQIENGRHPAIDEIITDHYIANDVKMFLDSSRTMIITGPNMGGKSSYVRKVALTVIMAQVGAFVPASKARLSLFDAVYTRMGAYDNMIAGESTFQVELKECAEILRHATRRSLVLLDEIGRGTSTTDGVAIAYSVLDHIVSQIGAFTLFITHYPLITELAQQYPRVCTNWCMEFLENEHTKVVTFLYKIKQGVSHRSYGLNVARLAALPESIIDLAAVKSQQLERELEAYRLKALVHRALNGDVSGLYKRLNT